MSYKVEYYSQQNPISKETFFLASAFFGGLPLSLLKIIK
ncbi:MAG: hypothetical protein AVDCRST_MAG96-2357 [uncultured Segetibacter sp.]|uniref:Uncharacterized protein n=1 Tax=uncultured Segetibacter sp. TaxID=481133 RepID=A0A6J4SYQ5_9BACT|nr:MAG: hypothetical protein AVDCRST_MAG96-2357 [uncultured Segetibacter sp.]